MEELNVIRQALEIATQKGAFGMNDVVAIYQTLAKLEEKLKANEQERTN
jgi:hypothetical protein